MLHAVSMHAVLRPVLYVVLIAVLLHAAAHAVLGALASQAAGDPFSLHLCRRVNYINDLSLHTNTLNYHAAPKLGSPTTPRPVPDVNEPLYVGRFGLGGKCELFHSSLCLPICA